MDYKRVLRNLWGWFVVCVWIVGVPHTLRYAWIGTGEAMSEAKALVMPNREDPEDGERLTTMSQSEFDALMELREVQRLSKQRKGR